MRQAAQIELFEIEAERPVSALSDADRRWKTIRQSHGAAGRYRKLSTTMIEADFGKGEVVTGRWQQSQGGRWYGSYAGKQIWVRGRTGWIRGWLTAASQIVQLVRNAREMARAAKEVEAMASRHLSDLEKFHGEAQAHREPATPQRKRVRRSTMVTIPSVRVPGAKPGRYFNPFKVDWRGTKQFLQMPEWTLRAPITPISQIVYSRLLFPLAGDEGFCDRFDKDLGIVIGLNCGALAHHLGKEKPDYIERVVKELAAPEVALIELHGSQGQTKTVRFLRTPWMSKEWLRACRASNQQPSQKPGGTKRDKLPGEHRTEVPSDKLSEVPGPTSDKLSEAGTQLPTNSREFPSTKETSLNKSRVEKPEQRLRTPQTNAGIGNQELSAEKGDTDIVDPLWSKLIATVGWVEMHKFEKLWRKRLNLCRDALATAVSDFNAMTKENQLKYNAAAYITTAFENEKRRNGG